MSARFLTLRNRVQGAGAARSGTAHFWWQRVSAIANIPLLLFLVWFVARYLPQPFDDALDGFTHPINVIVLIMAILSLCFHMALGMRVIVEDYVQGGLRVALVVLNVFFSSALAVALVFLTLRLHVLGS